jgi:hypothetical protein
MARTTISQRIALAGVEEIRKQLADLGVTGERAINQIQGAAASLNASTGGGFGGFVNNLNAAAKALGPLGNQTATVARQMVSLGSAVGSTSTKLLAFAGISVAGATTALLTLAKTASDSINELQDQAAGLGITVNQLQSYRLAAARAGTDQDAFTLALGRFTASLGAAARSTGLLKNNFSSTVTTLKGGLQSVSSQAEILRGNLKSTNSELSGVVAVIRGGLPQINDTSNAFTALGYSAQQIARLAQDPNKALAEIAAKINQIPVAAERATAAQEVFGKGWQKTLPLLLNWQKAVEEAEADIAKLGLALDKADLAGQEAFTRSYETFKFVANFVRDTVGARIGGALAPLFDFVTQLLSQNIETIRAWADNFAKYISQIGQDLKFLVSGEQGPIQHPELESIYNALITIKQQAPAAKEAVLGFLGAITTALGLAATAINTLTLGYTDFNATSLAAVLVLGKLTGAFGILTTAVELFTGAMKLAGLAIKGLAAVAAVVSQVVIGLVTGLAAILGLPAEVVAAIIAAVAALAIAIYVYWDDIKAAGVAAWNAIVDAGKSLLDGLQKLWGYLVDGAQKAWAGLVKFWNDYVVQPLTDATNAVVGFIKDAWAGLVGAIADGFTWLEGWVTGIIDKILGWINSAIDAAKSLLSFLGGASSSTDAGAAAAGFAGGGLIRGPGSSTSDSVPIRASAGEYIVRGAAVDHYGVGFLHAINQMRLAVQGFSLGGLVEALGPPPLSRVGFADGGLVGAGGPQSVVNLSLFGEGIGQLITDETVARKLTNFANTRALRSAGRKPSWAGGGRG